MGLTLVTPAATYPVTLAEAKAQCRVDHSDEDGTLNALIAAATDYVEQYCGKALVSQTWLLSLDAFTDAIEIPLGPVQSVSSVKYYDADNIEQTVSSADYVVDLATNPQWIVRNSDTAWPATATGVNVVNITFVAGYATMPPAIKLALLLLVSAWYDNREGAMPTAVSALLSPFRRFLI